MTLEHVASGEKVPKGSPDWWRPSLEMCHARDVVLYSFSISATEASWPDMMNLEMAIIEV